MSTEPLERRLAAILYADVAGYSRLTGEDEEGTHRTLRAYLETITSHIQNRTGRVVHYAGDAVLAEFTTVSEALSCAVDVQNDFNERNRHLADDRKVQFRIGVNLGEVIVDQDEIYGDGVNVAARLESLADPGGITISESVRSAIGRNLPLDYAFMGEQQVKNIAEPVRAYRVLLKGDAGSKAVPGLSPRRRRTAMTGAALVVVAIAAGVLAWLKPWSPSLESAPGEATIVAPPDKTSIAVLPFANFSDDPEQEYFSDGLTDDLITDLSKISGLFVIARNSVFIYKGKPVRIPQVADELGVHYVLEGSVRRAGDKVRINAQLIDGKTGGHLWAERYDGEFSDVFTLQDQVTRKIVTALEVQLTPQEQAISTGKGTQNVAAYDAFLKGYELLQRKTPENAVRAISHFERALQLDPNFSRANVGLAQIYWEYSSDTKFNELTGNYEAGTGSWGGEGYINDVAAWEYLKRAGDTPVSLAHALAARMLQRQRRFEEAMQEARRGVTLGPSDPIAYDALIEILIYAGEVEEALELIDESIRLDPSLPGEKLFLRGLAYYSMGRLEDALASIERARSHNPFQTRYAAIQAVTLAELDRVDGAMAAFEDYRSALTDSFVTLNWALLNWPFQNSEQSERLAKGLLKAGLQDSLQRTYVVSAQYRLRNDEIRALLAGKTVTGIDRGPAGHEEFEYSRNEDLQIVSQPSLTYFRMGTAKSRVENDLVCDPWRDFGDYCVAIYRNPDGTRQTKDEYVIFTLFGIFTFSVSDSSGG